MTMAAGAGLLAAFPDARAWPEPAAGIPMQGHAWAAARWELLPPGARRHLLAISDADEIHAAALLVRAGDWLREPPALFEPGDLHWRDEASLQTLAHSLASQPLPLLLERVPATSPTLAALRQAYAGRGWLRVRPAMPTPFITLAGRGSDCDAWFNAGRRADFRRAERKAAGFGRLTYTLHAPGDDAELPGLLGEAYGVETRSWKAAARSALTTDPVQGAFFSRLAHALARQGELRLAFLRLDGHPVAMQIACIWQDRFWLFKISHDRAFDACSPGQLLIRHSLGHAAANGLQSYEFLGLMAPWTRLWTDTQREYQRIEAIPYTALAARMFLKRGLRSALTALRGRRGAT